MKKLAVSLVASAAALILGAAVAVGAVPGNAPDTSVNGWPVQIGDTAISNCCLQFANTKPPIKILWWLQSPLAPANDPGLYKTIYLKPHAEADSADSTLYPNEQPVSFFQKNHPDWLEFTCAAATVSESTALSKGYLAIEGGHPGPYNFGLDMANPATLSWEEANIWGPIAASGKFQGLAFDNFSIVEPTKGGSPCGHYSTAGKWVQEYAPPSGEAWRQFETSELASIHSWLAANYPNVSLGANYAWSDRYLADEAAAVSHLDMWMNESGFVQSNQSGTPTLDSHWKDLAAATNTYTNGTSGAFHGWLDVNKTPSSFVNQTHAQRQWILGNYLMFKNSHSWVWSAGQTNTCGGGADSEYGCGPLVMPELAKATVGTATDTYYANQGVYRRDFTNGIVFVNPSSTTNVTVTLPAGSFKDTYGTSYSGKVTLGHGTALTLVG